MIRSPGMLARSLVLLALAIPGRIVAQEGGGEGGAPPAPEGGEE